MRPGRAAAAISLALAAGSGAGCRERPKETPPPRNLVVVTIDTLRADRVGAYGNRTVETPHLDGLARDGAIALDASVHAPLTRPSHVSLFTGLLPAQHGIRDNVSPALGDEVPTLAEGLKAAGFADVSIPDRGESVPV